jgi:signal recognition particle GTPase
VLETLTQGFTAARERLAGVRELSEENVDDALRDVRMSLLEADVDLAVVRDFLARVREGASARRSRRGCATPTAAASGDARPALREGVRGGAGRADGAGRPSLPVRDGVPR